MTPHPHSRDWTVWAEKLAAPILAAARGAGLAAEMPVETGPAFPADTRAPYSPLEAVGRLLCGIAPLLEAQATGRRGDSAIQLEDVHHLIDVSTRPGPGMLNFSKGTQPLVDAAFLAQALLRAPTALWEELEADTQDNLVRALRRTRKIKPHFNNWLLFSAMIEAALRRFGQPWDRMRVDYALRQHAQWYVGDGLYGDGPHLRLDYYNSYVIQPMLLDVLDAVQGEDAQWDKMRPRLEARARRHCETLERMIGPDGGFPPLGRSITYRCGAFHLLAQSALRGALPDTVPPAQARAALSAVIASTLGHPDTFDSQGWLRIGLSGHQPELAERYISTGSLYLCSLALLPLGLADSDAFWADPDLAFTQQRIWRDRADLPPDKALDD